MLLSSATAKDEIQYACSQSERLPQAGRRTWKTSGQRSERRSNFFCRWSREYRESRVVNREDASEENSGLREPLMKRAVARQSDTSRRN